MTFKISLWKADGDNLLEISETTLDREEWLENWIEENHSILGVELLLVGRQVVTDFGGRIDLLGIDRQGDIVIIELKRGKSPREVVAQVLDYASWVKGLSYTHINAIASKYLNDTLSAAFSKYFDEPLPEKINANHSMMIVASGLDDTSERIVQYLANEYDVNINVVFFNHFEVDGKEFLARAWLMDPEEVQEKAAARKQAPWSGYWFANVGEGIHRNWDDNIKYGYIGAGHGEKYSRPLRHLKQGNKIFAYLKGRGYVGYGEVLEEVKMVKDFIVSDKNISLLEMDDLKAPNIRDDSDDPAMSEWAVRVKWLKKYPRDQAKTFKGVFANQNIVCKLKHEATVEFLEKHFVKPAG